MACDSAGIHFILSATHSHRPIQINWDVVLGQPAIRRRVGLPALMRAAKWSPAIYQELIPKRFDLRVTIVGHKIYAAAIDSQSDPAAALDWRQTDNPRLPHHPVTLPDEISDKLLRMMEALRLTFGAVDMVLTPDGEYVFLEVNPNGQWLWIDDTLGYGISHAVAEWLAGARV